MDELTVRNEALVRILREREEQIQQLQLVFFILYVHIFTTKIT